MIEAMLVFLLLTTKAFLAFETGNKCVGGRRTGRKELVVTQKWSLGMILIEARKVLQQTNCLLHSNISNSINLLTGLLIIQPQVFY